MQPFLRGFAVELVKIADDSSTLAEAKQDVKSLPNDPGTIQRLKRGGPVKRNYLSSAVIGGLAAPLVAIAGKGISRALHNRAVRRAIEEAPSLGGARKRLESELLTGPVVGRIRPELPINARPQLTHSDLIGDAAKGALMGSIVQSVRDRYSGSGQKPVKS